jgi:hypothetical protein
MGGVVHLPPLQPPAAAKVYLQKAWWPAVLATAEAKDYDGYFSLLLSRDA